MAAAVPFTLIHEGAAQAKTNFSINILCADTDTGAAFLDENGKFAYHIVSF